MLQVSQWYYLVHSGSLRTFKHIWDMMHNFLLILLVVFRLIAPNLRLHLYIPIDWLVINWYANHRNPKFVTSPLQFSIEKLILIVLSTGHLRGLWRIHQDVHMKGAVRMICPQIWLYVHQFRPSNMTIDTRKSTFYTNVSLFEL